MSRWTILVGVYIWKFCWTSLQCVEIILIGYIASIVTMQCFISYVPAPLRL